jgi:hypothetical protein
MNILSHILAAAALMAGAVIYGTDVFCAIVQRPALAHVDEGALTGHVRPPAPQLPCGRPPSRLRIRPAPLADSSCPAQRLPVTRPHLKPLLRL